MGLLSSLAIGFAGKLFDRKSDRKRQASAEAYQDPAAIRKRYEAAGFNPLLAFQGNGAGTIAPVVGQSSAASQLIGAALDRDQSDKIAKSQLEQENRRLEMMAEELAMKAPSRSIYGAGTVANGVGGGVKGAATDALPSPGPEVMDEAPTMRLDEDDQGAFPPEELAMINATTGQLFPWMEEIAQRNAPSMVRTINTYTPSGFGAKVGRKIGGRLREHVFPLFAAPKYTADPYKAPRRGDTWR